MTAKRHQTDFIRLYDQGRYTCYWLATTLALSKELFGFFEKALSDWRFAAVTERGEFLEFGALLGGQARWDFDLYARMEVAMAVALEVFDAFAFDPKRRPGLRAGGDLNHRLAFERGYFNFRPERRLNETDGDFAVQIIAVTLKDFMGRDVQDDV
jgi:hypothetical protein